MSTQSRSPSQVFALVDLATGEIEKTMLLPDYMTGLLDKSLVDLSWVGKDHDGIWVGKGLWPVVSVSAPLPLVDELAVDSETKTAYLAA